MHKAVKNYLAICLIYILIGILYTFPMIMHFRSGVPYTRYGAKDSNVQHGIQGDHLQLYYRFWLFKDMLQGNSGLFESRYEFNTGDGKSFLIGSYFMPYPLIFMAFSWLGKGAGYNAVILTSCLFCGISMYLLVFFYTKNRFASILAGILFTAAPYRTMSILSGHPTGLSIFYVPLFILFLEKTLQTKSIKYAIGGGLTFIFLADNDLHTLYLTGLISPVFILKYFVEAGLKNFVEEVKQLILPAIILAVLTTGALAIKLSRTSLTGSGMERGISEVYAYSPKSDDILDRINDKMSRFAYLGVSACVFVGVIFIISLINKLRGKLDKKEIGQLTFFILLTLVFYFLVFGPGIKFSNPYRLLREYMPMFSMIRQTTKMMVIAVFGLSISAGFSFNFLRKSVVGKKGIILSIIILAICLLDFSPLPSRGAGISILPEGNKAYEKVFSEKADARVVCVPIWPGNDAWASHYQYFATIYRTVMINGYSAVQPKNYSMEVFQPLKSLNAGQLSRTQYDLLRKMKVEYVILHEQAFPPKVSLFPSYFTLDNLLKSPFLELASEDTPITIFRILDESNIKENPNPIGTSIAGIVYEAESIGGGIILEDNNASNNKCLFFNEDGEYSAVIRRRATPGGNFNFSSRVKTEGITSLKISVIYADNGSELKSQSFNINTGGEFEIVSMDFLLKEFASLYYKIEKKGGGKIFIDWFHIKFSDQNYFLEQFEFEEVYHTGNMKERAGASQGKAVFLTNTDPCGRATRGPYRLLDKGEYEITIAMELDNTQKAPDEYVVASITLRNAMDEMKGNKDKPYNILMPEKNIKAGDFAEGAGFVKFNYLFVLDRPQFISVNINHFGYNLYIDRVELRRVGD